MSALDDLLADYAHLRTAEADCNIADRDALVERVKRDAARLALWPELVAAIERIVKRDELWGSGRLCKTPAHEDAVNVLAKAKELG